MGAEVRAAVSKRDLFCAFFRVGMSSFGGAQPWARRELVERRAWLTNDEFAELLGLGQVLPGPNVVNLSIMVGRRYQSAAGAFLAISGLMLVPLLVILCLAAVYAQYGAIPVVRQAFGGVAVGTAGLMAATGIKTYLKHRRSWQGALLLVLAFVAAGILGWPLWSVLVILVPVGALLHVGSRP